MAHGAESVFTKTMTSGATLTLAYNLQRTWEKVYLDIPTMVSGTDFYIQACGTEDGTFRRVMHPAINDSAVTLNTFIVGSAATNRIVPIPNGFQYIKVETSTAMTDTTTVFRVICSD